MSQKEEKQKNKSKDNPSKLFVFLYELKKGTIRAKTKAGFIEIMQDHYKIANSAVVLDFMLNNKIVAFYKEGIQSEFDEVTVNLCNSINEGSDLVRKEMRKNQSLNRKNKKEKTEQLELSELFDFGFAIRNLKLGSKLRRLGWNEKDSFLAMVQWDFSVNVSDCEFPLLPWIGVKTKDGNFVPWTPSQIDVLAFDWIIVK